MSSNPPTAMAPPTPYSNPLNSWRDSPPSFPNLRIISFVITAFFAANHKHRKIIVRENVDDETPKPSPMPKYQRLRWAERLKHVFKLDLTSCPICQGKLRIIAAIEQPDVIARILEHLAKQDDGSARAPPQPDLVPVQQRLFS